MKNILASYPILQTGESQSTYQWVILALIWLSYCVFGLISRSLAPLVTPIVKDLGISYSQMGIIMGAWPMTYILVSLFGGIILDRWGAHKSLFIGICIIGLSSTLRYFAGGFGTMFIFVALFGMGGPIISIGAPKTISLWFKGRSRGTAVGIYTTAPWVGALVAFSMTNSVFMPLTDNNWRMALVIYGGFAFAAALLWLILAKDITSPGSVTDAGVFEVFKKLIRVSNVRIIILIGFMHFIIIHGFINWLPGLLEDSGLSPTIAGFASSIPTLVSIPTVLILPRLLAPHQRGWALALGSLALGIALMTVSLTFKGYLIFGLVFLGVSSSYIMPLLMLIMMETRGVEARYMGAAGGIFFCVSEIGGFVGPLIVGTLVDMTGSFILGMLFLACLGGVLSVLSLKLKS